jgi:hypothetical protein
MFRNDNISSPITNRGNDEKKSIMFSCNLDSIDSVSEFIRKVYSAITPKCSDFKSRIRRYGDKRSNNIVIFLTMPKAFINLLFTPEEQKSIHLRDNIDIHYFFDKNILKKTDKLSGKEEIFVLMKIVKNKSA